MISQFEAAIAQIVALAQSTWTHAPYNAAWNATAHPVFVDDFLWYALAFLRVGDWTGDPAWRQRAADLYEWGWTFGWDHRRVATAGKVGKEEL